MAGSGRSFLPEWAVRLGTASYSIYLVHIIALILTQQALRRLRLVMDLPLEIAYVAMVVSGVAAGVVFSHLVKRPLLRFGRSLGRQTG